MGRRTPVESGSVDSCSYEFDREAVGRGEDPVERTVKSNAGTAVLRAWLLQVIGNWPETATRTIIVCPFAAKFRG